MLLVSDSVSVSVLDLVSDSDLDVVASDFSGLESPVSDSNSNPLLVADSSDFCSTTVIFLDFPPHPSSFPIF